jgi:hypothetical protein
MFTTAVHACVYAVGCDVSHTTLLRYHANASAQNAKTIEVQRVQLTLERSFDKMEIQKKTIALAYTHKTT